MSREEEGQQPHAVLASMDSCRSKVRDQLENAIPGMGTDLEKALFNWTLDTCQYDGIPLYWQEPRVRYRYTTKAWSIRFNLTNPKNPKLKEAVVGNMLSAERLMRLRPAELFPELWEPVFEKVATKQLRKMLTHDVDSCPDGAFTCSKCKSKKTMYTELQTRSADEPMTLYVQCLKCGKRWKQ